MTEEEESILEVGGRYFNVIRAKNEVADRFPAEMVYFETVIRHTTKLPDFWKQLNHNVRLGKYRQLRDFCEGRVNDAHFEALWHFSKLMLTLQMLYFSHFQNFNSRQLMEIFATVLLRLEGFSLANRVHRLKLTIRNDIENLRNHPKLNGMDIWWMSTLVAQETLFIF